MRRSLSEHVGEANTSVSDRIAASSAAAMAGGISTSFTTNCSAMSVAVAPTGSQWKTIGRGMSRSPMR